MLRTLIPALLAASISLHAQIQQPPPGTPPGTPPAVPQPPQAPNEGGVPNADAPPADISMMLGGTFKANEGIIIRVPLDTLAVLNGSYPIDSAGYVNLPVVGRLYVHDQTSVQVESYLGKRMSQYLRDTHVMTTPVVRIALLGYWQRPGMHYVDPSLSVWDACRVSGGPAGAVNIDKWQVRRGSQLLAINLLDEFSKGTSLRNAGVRSGDIFIIPVPNPQSGFWYWFRETLTVTAQVAGIVGTALTAYVTYLVLDDQNATP